MDVPQSLRHRGGIGTRIERMRPDPEVFQRIGGRASVAAIIDALYDRIVLDPELRPMFPGDEMLRDERTKLKAFFEEWLGGEPLWSHRHGGHGLARIHAHLHIAPEHAGRWLGHFRAALDGAKVPPRDIDAIFAVLAPLARAFVNEDAPPDSPKHLRCHRMGRLRGPRDLAARGKLEELRSALDGDGAGLLEAPGMGHELLWHAAERGRAPVVEILLERGADPDAPHVAGWGDPMLSPLCIARLRERREVVGVLLAHGTKSDVFTAAFLGELEELRAVLDAEPPLANASDPADDYWHVTPLHHAVRGERRDAIDLLFERGADLGPAHRPLLEHAAGSGDLELTRRLLDRGADARLIEPGDWVRHREIAALLLARGASVGTAHTWWSEGQWIWVSCTGNNSQRDDPELVEAFLRAGAGVEDRRRGKTPLHFASKAGFHRVMEVLLEAGADPNARDADGLTPLHHALKAGKRADALRTVEMLIAAGADPNAPDRRGHTPLMAASRIRRADARAIREAMER